MAQNKMTVKSDYMQKDYEDLYYLYGIGLNKTVWVILTGIVWTAVVIAILSIVMWGLDEKVNQVFFVVVSFMVLFAAIYLPMYPWMLKRIAKKQVDKEYMEGTREDNKKRLEISDKGIYVFSFGERRYFSWSDVKKAKRNKDHLLLVYTSGEPLVLNYKDFSDEQQELLKTLCKKRIVMFP